MNLDHPMSVSRFQRLSAACLLFAYGNLVVPVGPLLVAAMAEPLLPAPQMTMPAPVRTPGRVSVKRVVPATISANQTTGFSAQPTEQEIFRTRIFEEPFIAVGRVPTAAENIALAAAITTFNSFGASDLTPFETFLAEHPGTAWAASVHLNLGLRHFATGRFTLAMMHFEAAWQAARLVEEPRGHALADRAYGELLLMNARVGRKERVAQLLQEAEGRAFTGKATEMVAGARDGLNLMLTHPELAYRCGPGALDRILANRDNTRGFHPVLSQIPSTDHGTSLDNVAIWAAQVGLDMQLAYRSPGAAILTPAVVHWKLGHYSALFQAGSEQYRIEDPTFGARMTAAPASIDAEASGYFLVPAGSLPAGWRSVLPAEAANVWGKGATNNFSVNNTKANDKKVIDECGNRGMAVVNAHAAVVSLNLTDTPVGYAPPFGPSVAFTITYNQREASQPTLPDYSNLGTKWLHNWLSFVDEVVFAAPTPGSGMIEGFLLPTVRMPGGGSSPFSLAPDYTAYPFVFPRTSSTAARLKKIDASTYVLVDTDGSQLVFGHKSGSSSPYRYMLTQQVDSNGNAVAFSYDSQNRLVAVTDALGQVTELSYDLAADPLKITKVTDPFGRFAVIEYDTSGRLTSITDVIGMASTFGYSGASDFVSSLTTPYGTSNFAYGESGAGGRNRWLEITNPLGEKERVECRNDWSGLPGAGPVPQGMTLESNYQNYRNTLFWDRKAYKESYNAANPDQPVVVAGAHIYHWLHTDDTYNTASSVLDNEKYALEAGRIWYNYPGQPNPLVEGSTSKPSLVGRVLDDGTTQLHHYAYNAADNVVLHIDPLDRMTTYLYDTNNIDLLEVRQKTGSTAGVYEVLAKATYNAAHQPLTTTDAAGQMTTFTYNARGQPLTVTNAKSETTTFSYNTDGYLISVDGPLAGTADTTTFAYDGYGRLRTVTDSEGYAITTDYDAFDRPTLVTYPDATTQQVSYDRLDSHLVKDRRGHITQMKHNAIRQLIATTDPLGRVTQYGWCKCGALRLLVDPAGNTTSWTHDVRSRVTSKNYPDNSVVRYQYETNTSRLKAVVDAKGQVTNYSYAKDNQLLQVSYTNATVSTPSVTFTYEPYYPRVATMTDGVGTTTYSYGAIPTTPTLGAGRLASIDGPFANDTLAYTYDELGRVLTRSLDGSNNPVTSTYDPLGRVTGVTNLLGSFGFSYVGATGRLDRLTYPNGQQTNYGYYNNAGDQRLQRIENLGAGSSNLSTFGYTYDAEGVIQTWGKQIDNLAGQTGVFKYDLADQLTEGSMPAVPAGTTAFVYRYDRAGNRTSEQIDQAVAAGTHNNLNQVKTLSATGPIRFAGSLSEAGTVTVNGQAVAVAADHSFTGDVPLPPGSNTVAVVAKDPLNNTTTNHYTVAVASGTARSLSYDLNGNLTNKGNGQTCEWDAVNRLTKITYSGGARTEFTYDGWDRRVKIVEKNAGGSVTSEQRFVWGAEAQPVEERDAANTVTKRFYGGLGEQIGGASYYYTTDHLGSVREMTDGTGAVRARYDYDPYGRITKVSGDLEADFGFTGFYRHQVSGLNLTLYRAYDADLGRWLSRDPIEEEGGLNLYGYVDNDPTNWFDSDGLSKGGKRSLNVNDGGKVLTKSSTAAEVEAASKAARAAGKSAKHLKALEGLLKVIKRGGSMELLFIPDIVEKAAEEYGKGPAGKWIDVPYDENGCNYPAGKTRRVWLILRNPDGTIPLA